MSFTSEERRIFKYNAGPVTGPTAADPLAVLRGFVIEFEGKSLRDVVYDEWANTVEEGVEPVKPDNMSDKDFQEHIRLWKQDRAWIELMSNKAEQKLVDAARKVFGLDPFHNKETGAFGLVDEEVLEIVKDFMEFVR